MKLVHRILYEKYHGKIPENKFVDHIDRNRTNNAISNLRLVSRTQNNQNMPLAKTNTSGFKNITWHKLRSKWQVEFRVEVLHKSFGLYNNIEDAVKKRNEVITELNAKGHCFSKA